MAAPTIDIDYTNPAHVLAPMPAELRAMTSENGGSRFGYATKTFRTHNVNAGSETSETFLVSGIFFDASSGRQQNLVKALNVIFDLDLVDVAMEGKTAEGEDLFPKFLKRAINFFNDSNISEVYTTSKGQPVRIADASLDADKSVNSAVIKAYLTCLSQDDLIGLVKKVLPDHIEFISEQLNGKLPSAITYSGTGYHLHYHIADDEGWGDKAEAVLTSERFEQVRCNINEMKAGYKRLIKAFATSFGYSLDNKLSQIGTAATRDIGTLNIKNGENHKTVTQLTDVVDAEGNPLWDATSRLGLSDFVIPAEATQTSSSPTAEKVKAQRGRPAKPKAAVPLELSSDAKVTLNMNGNDYTITVEELQTMWGKLRDIGAVVEETSGPWKGQEKLSPIRLDWVSNGSLNAWVRRDPNDKHGALRFTLDVEKYSHVDPEAWHEGENGKKVGHWVYNGSLISMLEKGDKGQILVTPTNMHLIMEREPRLVGQMRYNSRLHRYEVSASLHRRVTNPTSFIHKAISSDAWLPMQDVHETAIGNILFDYFGRPVADKTLHAQLVLFCSRNGVDPVHNWVESQQWDGVSRVDTWLPELLNMKRSDENYGLYAAYGRTTILSIVRAAYTIPNDPVMLQTMLLLTGRQGDGKSTIAALLGGVKHLGRTYFSESELRFDKPADLMAQLRGKVVAEVPEMAAMSRSDMNTIKSFLTKGTEDQREAYNKHRSQFDRATYLIGTTNDLICLKDPTGNRRFMVVDMFSALDENNKGRRWDMPAFEAIIPQLYAEAYMRVVQGVGIPAARQKHLNRYASQVVEDWNLTQAEMELQAIANERHAVADVVGEAFNNILEGYLERGQLKIKSNIVVQELQQHYPHVKVTNQVMSNHMTRCGWVRKKSNGLAVWVHDGKPTPQGPTDPTNEPRRKSSKAETAPKAEKAPKAPKTEPKAEAEQLKHINSVEEAEKLINEGKIKMSDDDTQRFAGLMTRREGANAIAKLTIEGMIKTLVNSYINA